MVSVAVLLQVLIVVAALYDTARLLAPDGLHRSSRRRRHRAQLETAERRLVRQLLHGRIDAAAYRTGMRALADDEELPRRQRPGQGV